ncbi:MAG TPA: hypothetical protein VND43_02450 [Burkholderiales bacterium]|nr:hypothetical protein [Burkholderiales bacterium]
MACQARCQIQIRGGNPGTSACARPIRKQDIIHSIHGRLSDSRALTLKAYPEIFYGTNSLVADD